MSGLQVNNREINEALGDIEAIRQIIDRKVSPSGLRIEASVTALLLVVSLLFLAIEVISGGAITRDFLASAHDEELRYKGLLSLVTALAILVFGIYWLAWRRSREAQQSLKRLLNKQLPGLRLESFLSDLVLKFAILSLLVLIRRPDLVNVALLVYSADYVLQGRFFRIPDVLRFSLGVGLYILGAVSFIKGWAALSLSLGAFAVVCTASICFLIASIRGKSDAA